MRNIKRLTNGICASTLMLVAHYSFGQLYVPNLPLVSTTNQPTGNVGIGITTPTSKLDVRDGLITVVNTTTDGYSYLGRNAAPGNDSYFYHRMTSNFHILGSNKNGTGSLRKMGFAVGGWDTESNIKMTIDNSGKVGIGSLTPFGQLHLASDSDHEIRMSRASGLFGLRIFRNAQGGRFLIQNTDDSNVFGTRIQIEEGGPSWQNVLLNPDGGNVGIGTFHPDQKLTVNGTIHGREVKVDLAVPGPDYVFEKDYALPSLELIKTYIGQNKHLPEVPSAKEMEANGINLSEMNMLLLKKVEKLTLYILKQEEKAQLQSARLAEIEQMLNKLNQNKEK